MRILYIGDVMGRPGRSTVGKILPNLVKEKDIDFVLAQSENVSHGKGFLPNHMRELTEYGVDFFTGGNHSFEKPQILKALAEEDKPVVGPANIVGDEFPKGWKIAKTKKGNVLVISLLGSIFPEVFEIYNPLRIVDDILAKNETEEIDEIVVNLHGDYSSEKMMLGHYLDGRVSLVVGDHWHVPTADARILPGGTGYITDVGMCGSLESSLGIEFRGMVARWRDNEKTKQDIAEDKPWQFNAVLFDSDKKTIEYIREIIRG